MLTPSHAAVARDTALGLREPSMDVIDAVNRRMLVRAFKTDPVDGAVVHEANLTPDGTLSARAR